MATKKKSTRRQYPDEYKLAAADRVINGEKFGKVATDLGVADNVLRSWVRKVKMGELVAPASTKPTPTRPRPPWPKPGSIAATLPSNADGSITIPVQRVVPPQPVAYPSAEIGALREKLAAADAEIKRLRKVVRDLLGVD